MVKVYTEPPVLHFDITSLTQRLDVINQPRVERILSAADPPYQRIYSELSLLLHYHHPAIHGYTEGKVPHDICFYPPNTMQQESLDRYLSNYGGTIQPFVNDQLAIDALYSIGVALPLHKFAPLSWISGSVCNLE